MTHLVGEVCRAFALLRCSPPGCFPPWMQPGIREEELAAVGVRPVPAGKPAWLCHLLPGSGADAHPPGWGQRLDRDARGCRLSPLTRVLAWHVLPRRK